MILDDELIGRELYGPSDKFDWLLLHEKCQKGIRTNNSLEICDECMKSVSLKPEPSLNLFWAMVFGVVILVMLSVFY